MTTTTPVQHYRLAEKRKRFKEQFQLFVCLGMVLLMANMAVPDYRRTNNHSQEIDK